MTGHRDEVFGSQEILVAIVCSFRQNRIRTGAVPQKLSDLEDAINGVSIDTRSTGVAHQLEIEVTRPAGKSATGEALPHLGPGSQLPVRAGDLS